MVSNVFTLHETNVLISHQHFRPMFAIILSNIAMFSYAAYILHQMQKHLRSGSIENRYSSKRSNRSTFSHETKSLLKKQRDNAARQAARFVDFF